MNRSTLAAFRHLTRIAGVWAFSFLSRGDRMKWCAVLILVGFVLILNSFIAREAQFSVGILLATVGLVPPLSRFFQRVVEGFDHV